MSYLEQSTNWDTKGEILRPYRDRLAKALEEANKTVSVTEVNYQQALIDKNKAVEKRDSILEDQRALQRIEKTYPLDDFETKIKDVVQTKTELVKDGDDEFDDDETSEDDGGTHGRARRKRLQIKSKIVDLIRVTGSAQTLQQITDIISKEFGEDAVSTKTIQNRLGELTSDKLLNKTYQKETENYVYGLPDWFELNKLKNDYTPHLKMTFFSAVNVADAMNHSSDSVIDNGSEFA